MDAGTHFQIFTATIFLMRPGSGHQRFWNRPPRFSESARITWNTRAGREKRPETARNRRRRR